MTRLLATVLLLLAAVWITRPRKPVPTVPLEPFAEPWGEL